MSSLYTNISHLDGLEAVTNIIHNKRHLLPDYTPPTIVLRTLLELILTNNYFDYTNGHYKQIGGTAMGTKMAPHSGGLFMHHFETEVLKNHTDDLTSYLRFIDDIFFIWKKDLPNILNFIENINNQHPSIKLTFTYSLSSIDFLDTTVYFNENGDLHTKIHSKPTNKNLILHYSSYHPRHIKHNLIYTETLRYRTNTSEDSILEKELITLKGIFLARGYPDKVIDQQMTKALILDRTQLLTNKIRIPETETDTPKLIIKGQLHPTNIDLFRQIKESWTKNITDPKLLEIWPKPPLSSFMKQKTLKDHLTHTLQKPLDDTTPNTNALLDSLPLGPW